MTQYTDKSVVVWKRCYFLIIYSSATITWALFLLVICQAGLLNAFDQTICTRFRLQCSKNVMFSQRSLPFLRRCVKYFCSKYFVGWYESLPNTFKYMLSASAQLKNNNIKYFIFLRKTVFDDIYDNYICDARKEQFAYFKWLNELQTGVSIWCLLQNNALYKSVIKIARLNMTYMYYIESVVQSCYLFETTVCHVKYIIWTKWNHVYGRFTTTVVVVLPSYYLRQVIITLQVA